MGSTGIREGRSKVVCLRDTATPLTVYLYKPPTYNPQESPIVVVSRRNATFFCVSATSWM
jgi:hypothetical protein